MAIHYLRQIQGFSRNARLYLLAAFIRGIQFGIFRLIFNLYIVSLGYRQDFLGLLRALDPLVMLLASLQRRSCWPWVSCPRCPSPSPRCGGRPG